MALNSNALVPLATAKTFLGISGTSFDTEIERLINVCSQSIERICMRTLVNAQHTEYHHGGRTSHLQLREWPITGGPSANSKPQVFIDDSSNFTADTEVDDSNIFIDEMATSIVYKDGIWPRGTRNIKVIYDAGLGVGGAAAAMPSDLEDACLQYVRWQYQANNDRRHGIDQKTKNNETVRFTQGIPPFIMALIGPHVRTEFPVSTAPVRNH